MAIIETRSYNFGEGRERKEIKTLFPQLALDFCPCYILPPLKAPAT